MEGKDIIYEFLDYISYERRYSEFTEKSYEKDLFDFFTYLKRNNLNYKKIKYNDVNKYIEELVKLGYKSSSINRMCSSLRSFYKYLEGKKYIEHNPVKFINSLKEAKRLPNYFKYDEFLTMVSVLENDELGIRNRLIIEMLFALDKIAPGTASRYTLLYGIEVKFYSARVKLTNELETEGVKNLFTIGDGAGVTRGLIQASASGVYVAQTICARG